VVALRLPNCRPIDAMPRMRRRDLLAMKVIVNWKVGHGREAPGCGPAPVAQYGERRDCGVRRTQKVPTQTTAQESEAKRIVDHAQRREETYGPGPALRWCVVKLRRAWGRWAGGVWSCVAAIGVEANPSCFTAGAPAARGRDNRRMAMRVVETVLRNPNVQLPRDNACGQARSDGMRPPSERARPAVAILLGRRWNPSGLTCLRKNATRGICRRRAVRVVDVDLFWGRRDWRRRPAQRRSGRSVAPTGGSSGGRECQDDGDSLRRIRYQAEGDRHRP